MMVWNFLQSSAKCIITFCCTSRLLPTNTYHAQWMMICELQTLFHCIPVQYINLPSNQPEWTSTHQCTGCEKPIMGFILWNPTEDWFWVDLEGKKRKRLPFFELFFLLFFPFSFFPLFLSTDLTYLWTLLPTNPLTLTYLLTKLATPPPFFFLLFLLSSIFLFFLVFVWI
jgi:hypothetical protein